MQKEIVLFPVVYNGDTRSFYLTDTPEKLQKGMVYWVTRVEQDAYNTLYSIEGIPSEVGFNSCWFNNVPTYEAKIVVGWYPQVGKELTHFIRRPAGTDGHWQRMKKSSKIQAIHMISTERFVVYTHNSCYLVSIVSCF